MRENTKRIIFYVKSIRFLRYFKSVLAALLERNHEVTVVFDPTKTETVADDSLQRFQKKFPRFSWCIGPARTDWQRSIIPLRNIRNYRFLLRRHTVSWRLRRHFEYLPLSLQVLLSKTGVLGTALVRSVLVDWMCHIAEILTPPDRKITNYIHSGIPDALMVSYRSFPCASPDIDFIKSGRALRIPTVALVSSWDQPTTKSLIQVCADQTFVWNAEHADIVRREHRIPSSSIVVTGAPQFDVWFGRSTPFLSREAFCKQYGLVPQCSCVLYVASSGERNDVLVCELAAALRASAHSALRACTLLVRPYPGREFYAAAAALPNVVVLPAPEEKRRSLDDDADFFDAVFHSFAVVALTSTALLDTLVIERPGIMYQESRFADIQSDEHLGSLTQSGAFYIADSVSRLESVIQGLAQGNDRLQGARRAYLAQYIRPRGLTRPAGDIVADEVEKLMGSVSPTRE